MTIQSLAEELGRVFPLEKVIADIHRYVFGRSELLIATVELDEGSTFSIKHDTPIEIITRSLFKEEFEVGFGTGCRILVVIGGVASIESGIVYPNISFATLYYNEYGKVVTVDFHKTMR